MLQPIVLLLFAVALAATLLPQFQRHARDAALDRRFQPLLTRDYPQWDHGKTSFESGLARSGKGRVYVLSNPRYAGLQVSVDYVLIDDMSTEYPPSVDIVAPGIASDDGYFHNATDTAGFAREWNEFKPEPGAIVDNVRLFSYDDAKEYWMVWASEGEAVSWPEWSAMFERDKESGIWRGERFDRLD